MLLGDYRARFGSRRIISRRRLLALAGAGTAAASLSACGGRAAQNPSSGASPASRPAQPGGSFVWSRNKNDILDPQRVSSSDQQSIAAVYSRIFAFTTGPNPETAADHNIESDLGVSAESPDAVTWTVKLRTDAKFHNIAPVNGHAVEAEDVKSTFVRAIDPQNPNRGSLDFVDPSQIQTPDSSTVVFKLKYPYAPFRKTLAAPTYSWIFPREALAGSYDPRKVVIGSGPFTLDSYTPDLSATYKRNPDYYLKGRPIVDGMKLAIIPDPTQQLAQFTGGNLDEIGATQSQSYSAFDVDPIRRANPKAQVVKSRYSIPNHIMFQLGDPRSPFLDIRVREAFSMAIDRDVIGKSVWGGEYETIIHVPGYMGKWSMRIQDLDPKVQPFYKYNPAEAKKLLEAAGATNLQLKLTWANNFGTPQFTKAAETIGNFLTQVGVKNTLDVVDFNTVYINGGKGLKNGFYPPETVLLIAQAPYTEADEFIFNFFDSKSTNGNEKLSDPALDAMIDRERTMVNEDDRLKACTDIQRYLAEKMYGVSTVGTYNWAFVSPRVQNYQWTSSGGRPMETYAKLWIKR